MKKYLTSLFLLGMMVAFTGCDAAKETVDEAKDAGADLVESAKDMANIDFGDFDMKGMEKQLAGITDGFKDVTTKNVDELTSKISELSGSIGDWGIGDLTGPAKSAVDTVIAKFMDAMKGAMNGITDDGILSKLKPAVDQLMEKFNQFK